MVRDKGHSYPLYHYCLKHRMSLPSYNTFRLVGPWHSASFYLAILRRFHEAPGVKMYKSYKKSFYKKSLSHR